MKKDLLLNTNAENEDFASFVREIHLRDFRNYVAQDIVLASTFNVVAGPNAQGKTNLLEALYLLGTTRLLRGHRDAEAVRDGTAVARVEVIFTPSETSIALELKPGVRKRALINGLGLPRAADLLGRLPVVCISTEDMTLARGEPSDRRLFLDLELSSLYPSYLRHLSVYRRALEQRNALLKQAQEWMPPEENFEIWEVQLAEHGLALRTARESYLKKLKPHAQTFHAFLGAREKLEFVYVPKEVSFDEDEYLQKLAAGRLSDVRRGSTSIGPHRDELALEVEERDLRLFGSQGQQRTAVIALKLASRKVAQEKIGFPPLLLLDDILSDLDESRRGALTEVVLMHPGQTVLTCTEAAAAGAKILSDAKVFNVLGGRISVE